MSANGSCSIFRWESVRNVKILREIGASYLIKIKRLAPMSRLGTVAVKVCQDDLCGAASEEDSRPTSAAAASRRYWAEAVVVRIG